MTPRTWEILFIVSYFFWAPACGKGLGSAGGGNPGENGSSDPLTISSITPASAARGALLTLAGTGFTASATVAIGGVNCHSVTLVSASQLTCSAGAHAAGSADVVVARSAETATLPDGFIYKSFLYVANELDGQLEGFSISADGSLLSLGDPVITVPTPQTVAVDPFGKFIFVSCGTTGQSVVGTHAIDSTTGALGSLVASPLGATVVNHLAVHPTGNFLYATLEGTAPSLLALAIDRVTGAVSSVGPLGGTGAVNGIAITPDGLHLYGTIGLSDTIFGAEINAATGALAELASSPFGGGSAAQELAIAPSGEFVFVGLPAAASIKTYVRERVSGTLVPNSGSAGSSQSVDLRGLAPHPTRRILYLVSPVTDNVKSYSWDAGTGELTPFGTLFLDTGGGSTAIAVALGGQHAYVTLRDQAKVRVLNVSASSGALEMSGFAPTGVGRGPLGIAID